MQFPVLLSKLPWVILNPSVLVLNTVNLKEVINIQGKIHSYSGKKKAEGPLVIPKVYILALQRQIKNINKAGLEALCAHTGGNVILVAMVIKV